MHVDTPDLDRVHLVVAIKDQREGSSSSSSSSSTGAAVVVAIVVAAANPFKKLVQTMQGIFCDAILLRSPRAASTSVLMVGVLFRLPDPELTAPLIH